jgi:hypothetical protein
MNEHFCCWEKLYITCQNNFHDGRFNQIPNLAYGGLVKGISFTEKQVMASAAAKTMMATIHRTLSCVFPKKGKKRTRSA